MVIGKFEGDQGGDPTSSAFLHGRQSWEDSLMRDVHSWKVIKRERIVPIYEFLSDDLRDQVRNVMNAAINLQRIRPDTVFKVRSCNTKHCLAWQKFYYAQQKGYTGMVVCTSPLQSGTSNDNISWNFVVADTSTESFTSLATNDTLAHAPDVYLRYNDVIYIQPATIPDVAMKKKDREHYPIPTPSRRHAEDPSRRAPSPLPQHNPLYLHGSHNNRSPVTKTAPECSLRFFKSGKPNQADQWVIERVDDEAWDSFGSDIDVDAAIRRTAYVLKTDRFRLRHRATDGHYLCSHNETIEKIDVRKRPDDLIPRSIGGVHGAGVLARHYHEVLLLTRKECGEQKDEWEFFQIDARERS
ncbi:hypothetical protein BC936DRAFT_143221 [Jimgerdemannia flammicorona]|uniref:Uncharacterized protein n=1 Tax=Jimgerdemannia flammicorona TaxID=994334 RepID=A0A432ZZA1_9FUNG|nr:hypothetical protein BC936DRAFT_143221 [Jimgerdemannia flammicorona]